MRVTLTPGTYELICQKLADGQYASIEEVIEAAVVLLDEWDRWEQKALLLPKTELQTREVKSESANEE
jgi:Arc/MetJ-type ribon-helix-helix transcriptional regulator